MKFSGEKANINIEKQQKLNVARQEVEKIIDKLGLGIDEEIKDTVAVLKAMDISTSSSCAGHKSKEDGFGIPYVEVYTKAPEGWKEDKTKQDLWRVENLKQKEKIILLLSEFYKNRNVDTGSKLSIENIGIFGGFRIQSIYEKMPNESVEDIIKKITSYQKEMKDFTEFLKEKFLNEK